MKKSILFFITMTYALFSFAQIETSYSLDVFNGVENSIVADVTLIPGSEHSIRIIAAADDLKEISMEVSSGILKIKAKRKYIKWSKTQKIRIFVTFKELNSIKLHGAGDILCKGGIVAADLFIQLNGVGDINLYKLDVGNLNIQLNGAGDMELYGNAKSVAYKLNGPGDINAFQLKSKDVTASVNGAGDINLSASLKLNASISGVGNVKYKGNPSNVSVKSSGTGQVTKE